MQWMVVATMRRGVLAAPERMDAEGCARADAALALDEARAASAAWLRAHQASRIEPYRDGAGAAHVSSGPRSARVERMMGLAEGRKA